jgi:hypothetical protein
MLRAVVEDQVENRPAAAVETLGDAFLMWPLEGTAEILGPLLHSEKVQLVVVRQLLSALHFLTESQVPMPEGDLNHLLLPATLPAHQDLLVADVDRRVLRRCERAISRQRASGRSSAVEAALQYVDLCMAADGLLYVLPCKIQAARYFVQACTGADGSTPSRAAAHALANAALEQVGELPDKPHGGTKNVYSH